VAHTLRLLRDVQWNGRDVVGDRPRVLLASLAEARGAAVGVGVLIDELWPADRPAEPLKALQVVVSRVRKLTGVDVVRRHQSGYVLDLSPDRVDATDVVDRVARASRAMTDGDWRRVRAITDELVGVGVAEADAEGPIGRLRDRASTALREGTRLRAIASAKLGEHASALGPLEEVLAQTPDDEPVRAAALRSIAATSGVAAALDGYERYRRDLADRLGAVPGEELRRLHAELLAADDPVRDGVLYDDASLIGRDADLAQLREVIRSSRVTTILGPGGIGKTRLAHAMGRDAAQPVIRFVELVGVTDGAGLLPALGVALGVRETSGAGTRPLDLRARIIENLGAAPTLLILDNCEQIIDAVADLVGTLVGHTRDLTVVTTSRSPLRIRAERVYPLGELSETDGVRLFEERATAARPGVVLDRETVTELVRRLDGLPLAIELAAARVRAMSVRDVLDRIDRRFALLRDGSRSRPERHQTLLAVIDWSWNLLGDHERTALRRLSAFHDGFTLTAAEHVLDDPGAVAVIDALVQHSLLAVHEEDAVRYRMLETVREFGRDRLAETGEDRIARRAIRDWAVDRARELNRMVIGPDQVAAIDELRAEAGNLGNELRLALDGDDVAVVLTVAAALLMYWEITDGYPSVLPYIDRIGAVAVEHDAGPEECSAMRRLLTAVALTATITDRGNADDVIAKLRSLGPGDEPWFAGRVVAVLALVDAGEERMAGVLNGLAEDDDAYVRFHALYWLCHLRENAGDLEGALEASTQVIEACPTDDGPWLPASTRSIRAHLLLQLGRRDEAVPDAEFAIEPLMRLHATEDAKRLRLMIALADIAAGRVDRARAAVDEVAATGRFQRASGVGGLDGVRAEVAAALGDGTQARRLARRDLETNRAITIPGLETLRGFEPWTLVSLAHGIVMDARFSDDDGDDDRELVREAVERLAALLARKSTTIDLPVVGCLLFAIGLWRLARDEVDRDLTLRLLVIARRFGYNRGSPSMDWRVAEELAERNAPGRLQKVIAECAERPTDVLLDDLRALDGRLTV